MKENTNGALKGDAKLEKKLMELVGAEKRNEKTSRAGHFQFLPLKIIENSRSVLALVGFRNLFFPSGF